MANHPLTNELQQFIARHVHTIEQLETLCLLVESPDKTWPENEVFKRIQSSQQSVSTNLRYFTDTGLLTAEAGAGYRFSPAAEAPGPLAVELAKTYRERRMTVVETIYKTPDDAVRQFADAFRLRKDNK